MKLALHAGNLAYYATIMFDMPIMPEVMLA